MNHLLRFVTLALAAVAAAVLSAAPRQSPAAQDIP
jgi:hypothetical protein